MARAGKKVMQFLDSGRYIAVVSIGKMYLQKGCGKYLNWNGVTSTVRPVLLLLTSFSALA